MSITAAIWVAAFRAPPGRSMNDLLQALGRIRLRLCRDSRFKLVWTPREEDMRATKP